MVIFITTCARTKLGWGNNYPPRPAPGWGSRLLSERRQLFESLTRSDAQKLRGATCGPDFGQERLRGGVYLEARSRYARGQFTTSLDRDLGEAVNPWFEENRLYFLSALYGIVRADEYIQNYDVELSGTAESHWRDRQQVLTEALLRSIGPGRPQTIFDCCGEAKYSELIDWQAVKAEKIQVWHAVDAVRDGAHVRAAAGAFAAAFKPNTLNGRGVPEPYSDTNADLTWEAELSASSVVACEQRPRVFVIDTGLGELEQVTKEAIRRGWTSLFKFESAKTPEALANLQGTEQCVCIIPKDSHTYLRNWGAGKDPTIQFRSNVLKVNRVTELELRLGHR